MDPPLRVREDWWVFERPFFNGKEGRVDFRKNLMLKKDRQLYERTLIINKKTNIIYNVSTHTCLHYILY
nr:MAG TPA: hypothetical protein [Bacteriophage sp.]